MVTVLRSGGLRIVVFSNDHLPTHVHVFGAREAKINFFEVGEDSGADLGGGHDTEQRASRGAHVL